MSLPLATLDDLVTLSAPGAWGRIAAHAWEVCSAPLDQASAAETVVSRDRALQPLDLFLEAAGWDLWAELESSVPGAAAELRTWWQSHPAGRAVLILDGLSLREVPWILQGAELNGLRVLSARAARTELPPDTTPFARSLGFVARSALENNRAAGIAHAFVPARLESTALPFDDCRAWIGSEPDWVLWHHWPDHRLHDLAVAGQSIKSLAREAAALLSGPGFWQLVRRLAQCRRLLIASDHGYAASGLFQDVDEATGRYLKETFRSGRHAEATGALAGTLPPVDLELSSARGAHRYVLGRRRWRSQGGYPTLTHGGLTVLEVLTPLVELEVE